MKMAFWDRLLGQPENRGGSSGTRTVDESAALRLALESAKGEIARLEQANVILAENNRGLMSALDRAYIIAERVIASNGDLAKELARAVVELKHDGMEMPGVPVPRPDEGVFARRGPDETEVPQEVLDAIDDRASSAEIRRHLQGEARKAFRTLKRTEEHKNDDDDKVWDVVREMILQGEALP